MTLTRRVVAAGLAASLVPLGRTAAQSLPPEEDGFRVLAAAPLKMKLHPDAPAEAELWAFNGAVPGPTLRVRHGEEVRVRLRQPHAGARCRCTGTGCASRTPWTAPAG